MHVTRGTSARLNPTVSLRRRENEMGLRTEKNLHIIKLYIYVEM